MSTHLREVEFRFFATTIKWIAVRSGTDTHVPSGAAILGLCIVRIHKYLHRILIMVKMIPAEHLHVGFDTA